MRSLTRARPQVQNPPERADFYIYIRHPFRKGGRRQCSRHTRNAKSEGKHNRKFERRSRNRQPHTAASSFRLCGFHRKNHKETIPAHKIWISSIAQSMFCRPSSLPSEPVLASGALSTCWRATEMIIRAQMLMVNKEAQQNRTRTVSPAAIPSKANYRVKSKKHL